MQRIIQKVKQGVARVLTAFIALSMIVTALPSIEASAAEGEQLLSVQCSETDNTYINAAFGTIVNVPQGKYMLSVYTKATEGSIRLMARYANTYSNTDTFSNNNGGGKVRSNFTPVRSDFFSQTNYPAKQDWVRDLERNENRNQYSMTFDLTELSGVMVSEGMVNLLVGCDFIGITEGYVYGFEMYALDENGNPTGDNLIPNGHFSDGTNGWIFRDGQNANPSLAHTLVTVESLGYNTALDFFKEEVVLSVACSESGNINAAFGTIVNVPQGKYRLSAYTKATKGTMHLMARYANTYSNTDKFSYNNGGSTVRANFTPVVSEYFDQSNYPATQSWIKNLDMDENYYRSYMTFDLTELSGAMVNNGMVNLLIGCDFINSTAGYGYGFELYALDENGNPTGENLIPNGDFSDGTNGWIFRDGEGANPSLTNEVVKATDLGYTSSVGVFKLSKYADALIEQTEDGLMISNTSDEIAIGRVADETYNSSEGYEMSFVLDEKSSTDLNILLGFSGTNASNSSGILVQLMDSKINLNILDTGKSMQQFDYTALAAGDTVKVRVMNGNVVEIYVNDVLQVNYYLAEQLSGGVIPDGTVAFQLNNNGEYIKLHDLSVGNIADPYDGDFVYGNKIQFDYSCYNLIGSHDLDGDGYLDIVVTSNGNIYSGNRADYNNKIYICYGLANGEFEDPVALDVGVIPYELAMDDINDDGRVDIVVGIIGDIDGEDASIFLNNGDRTYEKKTITVPQCDPLNGHYSSNAVGTIGQQGGILCPAIADFDNDGYMDLVLTGYDRSLLYMYKGDGTGEFTLLHQYQSIDYGYGLHTAKAADFDGDGNMDLVVTNQDTTTSVEVFKGSGDCSLTLMHKYDFAKGSISYHVSINDFNKDGMLDFITCQYNGGLELFINQGTFEFTRESYTASVYSQLREVQVADLNGDGELDVATLARGTNSMSILYGTGDYTTGNYFADPAYYYVGMVPKGLSINDYNQDGVLDLALLRYSGKDILLMYGVSEDVDEPGTGEDTDTDEPGSGGDTDTDTDEPDNDTSVDIPDNSGDDGTDVDNSGNRADVSSGPKTGDSNNSMIWIVLCIGSAIPLIGLGLTLRKKHR